MIKSLILRILIFYALIASGYTYEGEAYMMGKGTMESDSEKEELGICPLMGNPASKDYSYTYKGKTYYFCCPMCIERFKKNPQEYISKIKEFNLETYQKAPAGEN